MTMTTVTLHKVKRPRPPTKDGKPRHRAVWMLRWYGQDGRRYGETIGDCRQMSERDAKARQREKQSNFDGERENPVAPDKITVSQLVERFIAAYASTWRPTTKVGCQIAGRHLEAAVGADMVAAEFDGRAVKRVLDYLEAPRETTGRPRSKQTVRKVLTRLAAIFDWAASEDQYFIRRNPFNTKTVRSKRRVKTQREQIRVYSRPEVEAMLTECPSLWWEAFVRLALGSGLRLNELAHLTWDDLDLSLGGGRVRVTAKRPRTFTVAGRTYPILEFESKAHTERSVPIGGAVVKILQRLQAQTKSRYVFLTLERLTILDAKLQAGKLRASYEPINNVLRNFKAIQTRAFAKLDGHHPVGTIHDCRRTYCTVMADVVPPHRLQKLAGHASIETTLGFYIHTDDAWDDRVRTASLGRAVQDTVQDTLRTHPPDAGRTKAAPAAA